MDLIGSVAITPDPVLQMIVKSITKMFASYLVDELVCSPSVVEAEHLPLIPRSAALRYADMYLEDVENELRRHGINPLDPRYLVEKLYALYDGGVAILGGGLPGELYADDLIDDLIRRNITARLHTHPVPLPIPTPEDVANAATLGYRVECVASRVARDKAFITCVSPRNDWVDVIEALKDLHNEVLSVEKFVVASAQSNLLFLPYPSENELEKLWRSFEKTLGTVAHISSTIVVG